LSLICSLRPVNAAVDPTECPFFKAPQVIPFSGPFFLRNFPRPRFSFQISCPCFFQHCSFGHLSSPVEDAVVPPSPTNIPARLRFSPLQIWRFICGLQVSNRFIQCAGDPLSLVNPIDTVLYDPFSFYILRPPKLPISPLPFPQWIVALPLSIAFPVESPYPKIVSLWFTASDCVVKRSGSRH